MTFLASLALALHLAHVEAATAAAGDDLPVEVVLAVAWRESGYTVPLHTEPWHCGPMQVNPAYVAASCASMRSLPVGYAAGAEILRRWIRLSGGRWREAIRGYRCGWEGLARDCAVEPGYDDKVLRVAAAFGWRP